MEQIVKWLLSCCGPDRKSEPQKLSQLLSPILSQSYRQRQSHDLADNLLLLELSKCWKWAVLLVIGTVPTIKVLETVRVAGASELLDMGSFAGKLQGFSYHSAGNCHGCWSYQIAENWQFCW